MVCVVKHGNWRTVAFNLSVVTFDYSAEMGPFGEVFQVEGGVVCLSEMVEVACIEVKQVRRCHGPY